MFYVSIVYPELESNAIKDVFCDENVVFSPVSILL